MIRLNHDKARCLVTVIFSLVLCILICRLDYFYVDSFKTHYNENGDDEIFLFTIIIK